MRLGLRCVLLLLAQEGRLCGLARPLARRPSDRRRTHPSVHRRNSASDEREGQAEFAEEHDSVLRVRHPRVGARWEGREGAARCIATL